MGIKSGDRSGSPHASAHLGCVAGTLAQAQDALRAAMPAWPTLANIARLGAEVLPRLPR